jgi:hypothetical protein
MLTGLAVRILLAEKIIMKLFKELVNSRHSVQWLEKVN